MSTPVLNNGIFVRDTKFNPMGNHIDKYHLFQLQNNEPLDLGVIDMWAMLQKKEMPLYTMSSFGGKNTIWSPTHEFTWSTPVHNSMPYIVEDISDTDKPGFMGQTFQIKLNTNAYGHGAILTYDKMNGLEMYVTEQPIVQVGDNFVYTVRLVNRKSEEYLDRKFLKAGTKIFRVGSARNEYGQKFDDFQMNAVGKRQFYNFVGEAKAHKQLSVSEDADAINRYRSEIVEIYRVNGSAADPSIVKLNDLASLKGKEFLSQKAAEGAVSMRWLPKLEAAALTELGKDLENYLMWGKGGMIRNDSADDIRLSVGLWRQLDNGFKRVYTKQNFSLEMFENEIYNFFNGKVNFDGPDSERELIIQTGLAGFKLINRAISERVGNSGFLIDATNIGAITGKGMNLKFGHHYVGYKIPFLANLTFVINPAFDNLNNNDIENPIIDGHPLSSYSFIIFDFNYEQGSDNIFLVKYAPGGDKREADIMWNYQQGTRPYLGISNAKGFASSGNFSGFVVNMWQRMPAIWVKDPTKVLKIVMRNPITGGSL
jgi:hypothetical protein